MGAEAHSAVAGGVRGRDGLPAPSAQHGARQAALAADVADLAPLLTRLAEIAGRIAAVAQVELDVSAGSRHMTSMDMGGHEGILADAAPEPAPLMTVADVARLLRVDDRTVRRWRTEKRLPKAVEIGGCIRWRRHVIEGWLAKQEAR